MFRYTGNRLGIRGKIFWSHEKCRWELKLERPRENVDTFCLKKKRNLRVKSSLCGDEFKADRDRALIDACYVWNALDMSVQDRIYIPEPGQFWPNQGVSASSQLAGSDNEGESDSGSEGEWRLIGG